MHNSPTRPNDPRDEVVIRADDAADGRWHPCFCTARVALDGGPTVGPAPDALARLRIREDVVVMDEGILRIEVLFRQCLREALDHLKIAHAIVLSWLRGAVNHGQADRASGTS